VLVYVLELTLSSMWNGSIGLTCGDIAHDESDDVKDIMSKMGKV